MCKKIFLFINAFLIFTIFAFSQSHKGWTSIEEKEYATLRSFCDYLLIIPREKQQSEIIFKNYFYFDYVLKDSSQERIHHRIDVFDTLTTGFKKYIDSVGLVNLEATPLRFFKDTEIYSDLVRDLKDLVASTFVYFDKRFPGKPRGYILFDPGSAKIDSWLLLNQGGYYYFLTFNML